MAEPEDFTHRLLPQIVTSANENMAKGINVKQ